MKTTTIPPGTVLTMVNVYSDLVRLARVSSTVVLAGLLGSTGPDHQVAAVVIRALLLAPGGPAAPSKY